MITVVGSQYHLLLGNEKITSLTFIKGTFTGDQEHSCPYSPQWAQWKMADSLLSAIRHKCQTQKQTKLQQGWKGGKPEFSFKKGLWSFYPYNLRKIFADMTCVTFSYFPSLCMKKLLWNPRERSLLDFSLTSIWRFPIRANRQSSLFHRGH